MYVEALTSIESEIHQRAHFEHRAMVTAAEKHLFRISVLYFFSAEKKFAHEITPKRIQTA